MGAGRLPRVGVVGGGLAGMAAALALAGRGAHVELFEANSRLGGRAGSFFDPAAGRWVDTCPHVAMGCCVNLLDFCRRTGVDGLFERGDTVRFVGPDATTYELAPTGWLPAPLHLLPAVLRLGYLSRRERLGIARATWRLARSGDDDADDSRTMAAWLDEQRQTAWAVERFWSLVLVSALGDSVGRVSVSAARKVFRDGFLGHRRAHEVLVPTVPLAELFDRRAAARLERCGVVLHRRTPVERLEGDAGGVRAMRLRDGRRCEMDRYVAAVPWYRIATLLDAELTAALADSAPPGVGPLGRLPASPISAVHLWFDRPVRIPAHAALVGRLSQWVFRQSDDSCQVVIGGNRQLAKHDRRATVEDVLGELTAVWPELAAARLAHWRVTHRPRAVFSAAPGVARQRPAQETAVPNLSLAGDWTRTGWPATMEGAVRSGYLAAENVLRESGTEAAIVVPELPRTRLCRWLGLGR